MLNEIYISTKYKKSKIGRYNDINNEDNFLAKHSKIDDRLEYSAKREAYITLKDHKPNFRHKSTCRIVDC